MCCCCCCVLSRKYCSSACVSASPAPLWYFSRIFLSWRQSFSIILHLPLRYFPPFNVPLIFILFPMWPPRPLKRFQIHTGEKSNGSSSSVPLVAFLMRLCFDTALLWLFFSPLIAHIPTSAELWLIIFCVCVCWERETQSQGILWRKGELHDYHVPQFISLDQMRPKSMNIWAQLSTAHRGLSRSDRPLLNQARGSVCPSAADG